MLERRQREPRSPLSVENSDVPGEPKQFDSPGRLMRASFARLSTLVLSGMICLQPVSAANLTLKFTDPGGKTLPKVNVRIIHLLTKRFEEEISDGQGQVVVAGLTDGKYELLAQLKNSFPIRKRLN